MLKSRQLYSKHWSGDAHHITHVMSEICQGDQRKLLTVKITMMINTVTSISNFIAPQRKLGLFPIGRPFEGICKEEVPPFGCCPCPRCTTVVGSIYLSTFPAPSDSMLGTGRPPLPSLTPPTSLTLLLSLSYPSPASLLFYLLLC